MSDFLINEIQVLVTSSSSSSSQKPVNQESGNSENESRMIETNKQPTLAPPTPTVVARPVKKASRERVKTSTTSLERQRQQQQLPKLKVFYKHKKTASSGLVNGSSLGVKELRMAAVAAATLTGAQLPSVRINPLILKALNK